MIWRIDPNRKKGDSTNYVYVVGDDKLSTDLKPISEAQNKQHTKMELDYKYNDPADPQHIYYRSDHYNFARKGVPIIFYFDGIHKDYHRPTDTPDKINYEFMVFCVCLVIYTAWVLFFLFVLFSFVFSFKPAAASFPFSSWNFLELVLKYKMPPGFIVCSVLLSNSGWSRWMS